MREAAKTFFLRHGQVGVAVPGGAEAMVHLAKRVLHGWELADGTGKVFLKVDFRNAFNMVDREAFLETLQTTFPELVHWANVCYATPSSLFYGDHKVASEAGSNRATPWAPYYSP